MSDYSYDKRAEEKEASALRVMASQIGQTILDQMGGIRRLNMMIGVSQYGWLPKGVYVKWKAGKRSKGNYMEITLRPDDTYDLEFFNVTIKAKKPVKKYSGVYADQLVELFEKQTGLYLRL